MTPGQANEDIIRANEAKHILDHHMVRTAFDSMRADAYLKIEMTTPGQVQEREYLYLYLKAMTNFERNFAEHIENGKIAKSFLERWKEQRAQRKRR